ncbi:MAG: VOC family protein [Anaerotignum propionicum]|uniref:VOC family protein n=1 Tax=Anaerotignum propionicum TaxID=28446 RepID=UPI002B20426E|nr:VOC family protein [Anaerotignum propionicum]MEA5056167.1 VOC family protein [Anaerotignum propionicum]
MNKITCICLGVRNMEKSIQFYRDKLGFLTEEKNDNPTVVFFNTPGTKFELFPLELLAQDISKDVPSEICSGFGGFTLAYNVKQKEDVEKVIEVARSAGAKIVKEPQDVFWGGYHAYFADMDGYYWEVVWGPDFKFDENGMLIF